MPFAFGMFGLSSSGRSFRALTWSSIRRAALLSFVLATGAGTPVAHAAPPGPRLHRETLIAQGSPAPDAAKSPFGAVATRPVWGVSEKEIRFGMAAPFTGTSKEFGRQLKMGAETAFNLVNGSGGVNGRQLKLISADDGYDPARTRDVVKRLHEQDQVMGLVSDFGTATTAEALPYILERKMLLLGAFTGANFLRNVPPDRYVFNYRPSYAEETEAAVRYLVQVRGVNSRDIVVFAQDDGFGEAGYNGVLKALRAIDRTQPIRPQHLKYQRNSMDLTQAIAQLRARKTPPKAMIMVAVYRPAAKFIEATRPLFPGMIYTNVSAVGSTALAEELMSSGPNLADGVIVTQIVPAVNGASKAVLDFKAALAKSFPGEAPDYVSFESYINALILVEGLKRAGPQLDTEKLVDALESINDLDLGLGTVLKYSPTEHQASHMVWGTQLDKSGQYRAIDLQ